MSEPQLLWTLNLREIKSDEIQCLKDRRFFSIEEDGDMHGVCIWFSCVFPHDTNMIAGKYALSLIRIPAENMKY